MVTPSGSLIQFIIPRTVEIQTRRKALGSMFICYVKGISKEFKCRVNRYNIRPIFKTNSNSSLIRTRQARNLQQTVPSVCNIPYLWGRSYNGETGRLLAMQLLYKQNLRDRVLEKSKLDHPAYEGHRVGWDEAKILETENNIRHRV